MAGATGTWSGVDQNNLALLARAGSQAMGLPAGVSYGVQLPIGLNDAGQTPLMRSHWQSE